MSSEYNANLNGLNHFELVHVGNTYQKETNSYAHHSTGIVDKSTGKLIAVMDPIPMSSIGEFPVPIGQGASVVGGNQTYDFEGGIMSPDEWTLSRTYGFLFHGDYGIGIVQDKR